MWVNWGGFFNFDYEASGDVLNLFKSFTTESDYLTQKREEIVLEDKARTNPKLLINQQIKRKAA